MDDIKKACDGISACASVATLAGALPTVLGAIAALLSIIWYGIRIYEWAKSK